MEPYAAWAAPPGPKGSPGSFGARSRWRWSAGVRGVPDLLQHLFGKIGLRSLQRGAGTGPARHQRLLTTADDAALPWDPGDPGDPWRVRRRRPGTKGSWNLGAWSASVFPVAPVFPVTPGSPPPPGVRHSQGRKILGIWRNTPGK
eukprot:gene8140-biopygen21125